MLVDYATAKTWSFDYEREIGVVCVFVFVRQVDTILSVVLWQKGRYGYRWYLHVWPSGLLGAFDSI